MKNWWKKQSARIDALSLRERVFLFLAVIAVCLALGDLVWLEPAKKVHRQLNQRFDKQNSDLQQARKELDAVATPLDTSKALKNEIAAAKTRLDEVNKSIKAVLPSATQSTPLAQVLVHVLRRHEGLTLVSTAALFPEAAVAGAAQVNQAAAGPGAVELPQGLTRQGVELTVSGSYPDLTRYVQTLEKLLPHVRWGTMRLKSEKLPPELTMQLYLIGVEP
jgi:MSHA biogenesis protein MshJ